MPPIWMGFWAQNSLNKGPFCRQIFLKHRWVSAKGLRDVWRMIRPSIEDRVFNEKLLLFARPQSAVACKIYPDPQNSQHVSNNSSNLKYLDVK